MNKLRIIFIVFLLSFLAISIKLLYIQVLSFGKYSANYTTTRQILPERGRIFDRNYEPLALNNTRYRLFVDTKKVEDRLDLIHILENELQIDQAALEARIDMSKDWVAVTGNISKDLKTKLESHKLNSIGFEIEQRRFYPEASLAAHLGGFMGKNKDGESVGYFGVEGYYDKDLTGLPGVLKSERDLFDKPIFSGNQERVEPNNGRDFVLTIDKSVQHIIKERLKAGMDKFKAKQGCVIVVKPQTMELMGLVCLPDFDPEKYYDYPGQDYKDWLISSVYEPGSTFKPLIMAVAIEEKLIKPDDIFNEDGPVKIGNYTIRNWNDQYDGEITATRILEKSSNVGMVHTGDLLGKEKVYEYIQKYGFSEYTNIDLQGEVKGQVKDLSDWYPIDAATTAFGQGISVTAIELVRAFASIINGGKLMRPYVVREVIENGNVKKRKPQLQRRVVSEETSKKMREMLSSVVHNAEVKWKLPEGYTFGGKTGTAQIAISGKYDVSKTIASFIGFTPAEDPEFLMLVVIQQPESSSWGSETAAPLFFDIARDLLIYYNVSPR